MHINRFLLTLFSGLWLSTAVQADTVFMVQLGSYDSAQEADSYWKNLVDENKKLLSGLTHVNSRISLPPENIETFRLQAGPIANRIDAKRICAALTAEQEDCFVVETAMFVGDEAAVQLAESNEDINVPAPVITSTPTAIEAADSGTTVFEDITSALFSPFVSDEEEAQEAAFIAEDETSLPAELPEVEVSMLKDELDTEAEALEAVEADSNNAIDELVAESEARILEITSSAVEIETASTPREELPWLRRENRVQASSDELPEAVNPPTVPSITELPIIEKPDNEIRVATQAPETNNLTANPPVRNRSNLKSTVIMQQLPGVKMVEVKSGIAPINASTQGSVEVAEAIAVPLSDISDTQDAIIASATPVTASGLPTFKGRKALGWRGTPSQSFLQKSFWVKLNYFENEAAAQQYWRELQRKHPTMTNKLRMRVTQPYSQRRAANRTSMQLGPLLAYKDVQALCKVAGSPGLVCEVQRDTGVSTASRSRSFDTVPDIQSRRDIGNRINNARVNEFWAQLGSYRNRGDAMKVWDELKVKHSNLSDKHPHLAHPPQSSSARTIYRLRTGPFSTRIAASNLCASLEASNTPCLVVNR